MKPGSSIPMDEDELRTMENGDEDSDGSIVEVVAAPRESARSSAHHDGDEKDTAEARFNESQTNEGKKFPAKYAVTIASSEKIVAIQNRDPLNALPNTFTLQKKKPPPRSKQDALRRGRNVQALPLFVHPGAEEQNVKKLKILLRLHRRSNERVKTDPKMETKNHPHDKAKVTVCQYHLPMVKSLERRKQHANSI